MYGMRTVDGQWMRWDDETCDRLDVDMLGDLGDATLCKAPHHAVKESKELIVFLEEKIREYQDIIRKLHTASVMEVHV